MRAKLEKVKRDAMKIREKALNAEKKRETRRERPQRGVDEENAEGRRRRRKKQKLASVPKRAASKSLELSEDEAAEEVRRSAKQRKQKESLKAPKATKSEKKAWRVDSTRQEALADEDEAQRVNGVFADRQG